jgi:hypothetical protein
MTFRERTAVEPLYHTGQSVLYAPRTNSARKLQSDHFDEARSWVGHHFDIGSLAGYDLHEARLRRRLRHAPLE